MEVEKEKERERKKERRGKKREEIKEIERNAVVDEGTVDGSRSDG